MKTFRIISAVFAFTSIGISSVHADSRALVAPAGAPLVSGARTAYTGQLGPAATRMQSQYTGPYSPTNLPTQADLSAGWESMTPEQKAWVVGTPAALGYRALGGQVVTSTGQAAYGGGYYYPMDNSITPGDAEAYSQMAYGTMSYQGEHPGVPAVSVLGTPGVSGLRTYATGELGPVATGLSSYDLAQQYPGAAFFSVAGLPAGVGVQYYYEQNGALPADGTLYYNYYGQ